MINVTTGFAADQKFSIEDDEAHKAYYLFLNPEARTIFSNGVAVRGQDIQNITPDYHGTMGWHRTHKLDSDDLEELQVTGVARKLAAVLSKAKTVANDAKVRPELLDMKLSDIKTEELGAKYGYEPKKLGTA